VRLCYIANPNSIHTQRWLRYFAKRGYEIHLIAVRTPQQTVPAGVILYDLTAQINTRKLRYLPWTGVVRRIVRQVRPDILHAHQVANAGWLGAAAGYHPLIVTAWGSDLLVGPGRFWTQRQLARWVIRQADYVTCVSQSLAQAARSLGADPSRLEVAPWGVNTDIFHPTPDREGLRAQLGLGRNPTVLSLRAMQSLYNPLSIAQAIPRVLDRIPTARFIIRTYNCDRDVLAQFQAIVRENRATGSVTYVSDLPDEQAIADQCRVADVAVSVPSSDGTPSSVLEAMACGTPAVLSDLPSLHEWVRHEKEGLFIPTGDVAALSAAIVRLLTDEALRSELGASSAQVIRERADAKVWMHRAEKIYQRLVERSL
jgi:glycosyltransferase involved in cell wall biosynthesis